MAHPGPALLPLPLQVFLTALSAPEPALRYFSTNRFLPLTRLRLDDPSGNNYVAAMHRVVFADQCALSMAQGPGRHEPGAAAAIPQ